MYYLLSTIISAALIAASVSAVPHPANSEIQGFTANNLCGGYFSDVAGISGSIDYWVGQAEVGQPEKTCVWLVIQSSLMEGYEVKITDLKMPANNNNCKNSKISINTFSYDNATHVESHVVCAKTEDYIQVSGNAIAIVLKAKKAVKGHGFRLEWRVTGEFLGIQRGVRAETSWNQADNLEWPGYYLSVNMHNSMAIYAFPKGNLSEAHQALEAVFDYIRFDKPSEICTDEFMLITAIENGALRLIDTICDTRSAGLTYESYGGFVFFVAMNPKWGTLYSSAFKFTYRTIETV